MYKKKYKDFIFHKYICEMHILADLNEIVKKNILLLKNKDDLWKKLRTTNSYLLIQNEIVEN